MKKINWITEKYESKRKIASSDQRWHIYETQKDNEKIKLSLNNYDLLLIPHGVGTNHQECFECFIEDCERYIKRIRNAQQEAKEYLESLLSVDKEQSK